MRKELCCPQIIKDGRIIGYGGDQEWFPGDFQRLAGCGSVTGSNIAVIYAMNKDEFKSLYQPEEGQDAKEQEQCETDADNVSIYEARIYGISIDRKICKRF